MLWPGLFGVAALVVDDINCYEKRISNGKFAIEQETYIE